MPNRTTWLMARDQLRSRLVLGTELPRCRASPSPRPPAGLPVRRVFAGVDLATLDPFVHMDQMGEVDYAPGEPKGTRGTPTGASRPSPT